MTTFIVDGEHITVATASELVKIMHANSRTPAADDEAYMMDVSDRTVLQDGGKIRTNTPEQFVNDLVQHGFIKKAGLLGAEEYPRLNSPAKDPK